CGPGLARRRRTAAELGEVAGIDGLRVRHRVVSVERAIVGGAVSRREALADLVVGIRLGVAATEQRADAVPELLDVLLVGQTSLPGQRRLLREGVDRNVVEALRLHAVANLVLDPALALLDTRAA